VAPGRTASQLNTYPAPEAGFGGTFRHVNITFDDLQVRHTPEIEQRRPRKVTVFAPHAEKWHPMVNLNGLPKSAASLGTTSILQALEQLDLIAGCRP